MRCERSVPGRGRDVSGGHACPRDARWLVTTPDGERLHVCAQHRNQLEAYWYGRRLAVEALAS